MYSAAISMAHNSWKAILFVATLVWLRGGKFVEQFVGKKIGNSQVELPNRSMTALVTKHSIAQHDFAATVEASYWSSGYFVDCEAFPLLRVLLGNMILQ